MRIPLLLCGILFTSSLSTPAPADPPIDPSPLELDLKLLQGQWAAGKVEGKLPGGFQFGFHKSTILISYFRGGGGFMQQVENLEAPFVMKLTRDKRRLVPTKKGSGVSEIIYRVQGDRLVIEAGTCGNNISLKGEWKRLPPGLP